MIAKIHYTLIDVPDKLGGGQHEKWYSECGLYIQVARITTDRDEVTCQQCRNTRLFRGESSGF